MQPYTPFRDDYGAFFHFEETVVG